MNFSLGGNVAAGLVVRSGGVELLSVHGKRVAARVSVPFEGRSDLPLVHAIQKAFEQSRLKTRKVAVSILTQDVLFRFFTMPAMPRNDWDGAVQFEVRKYIPFKMDTLVWDYHVMQPTQAKLEVIFAAIQRDTFGGILSSLAAAGVQPLLIEPRSMSLARLVPPEKTGKFACIVDVERTSAHVAIVRNGVPFLARDISLQAKADVAPDASGLDARAQRLLSELSVSIDFFMREYASTVGIERVWLFGEEQTLSPWCQPMAAQLQVPVELGAALVAPFVDSPVPLTFASAVGVTAAASDPGRVAIDFCKRGEKMVPAAKRAASQGMPSQQEITAILKTPHTAGFAVAMAGLLAGVWFLGSQQLQLEQRRLAMLRAPQGQVGYGLDGMTKAKLAPLMDETQANLSVLKRLLEHRISLAAKLDALARQAPEGVWLTGVTITETPGVEGSTGLQVAVKGACYLGEADQEMGAIQDYQDRLKRDAKFAEGLKSTRIDEISADAAEPVHRMFRLTGASTERY